MKKELKKQLQIVFRYVLILIIGLAINSNIVYRLLLALTIYPVNFLLSLFYQSSVVLNIIYINNLQIAIILACIAVSAYFLLLVLNLLTPMALKKRISSLLFSILALWFINILRIFIFSLLFINNYIYFDILHKASWYALSIAIVIFIWFLSTYIYKIKNIPVYSDFKLLISSFKSKSKKT